MASVTLGEMMHVSRALADAIDDPHTSDVVLTHWLNVELGKLFDLVVREAEQYFRSTASIPIDANTTTYPLPSDFYRLRCAYYAPTGGELMPLQRMGLRERGNSPGIPRYTIDGGELLLNKSAMAGTVELDYISSFTRLERPEDVLEPRNIPFSWLEMPMIGAAIYIRQSNDDDITVLEGKYDKAMAAITRSAGPIDRSIPEQTRIDDSWRHGANDMFWTVG